MNSPMYLFLAASIWIAPHMPFHIGIIFFITFSLFGFWISLRKNK